MATKKIAIGPGVTHPAVRHITVTASAIATLHELTEGRAFLGFGVGATGPGNIGMKPVTVKELEECIEVLKQLFRGGTVKLAGRDVRCLFPCGEVPIYIGTRAPQVMKMACRLANGFIHAGSIESLKDLVNRIRGYAAEAGRNPGEVQFISRLPCAIDNDASRARQQVKGVIARTALTQLGRLYNRGELHDENDRKAVERMRQHYDTYRHMQSAHDHLVREEWVDRFAIAGTPDQVRIKVKEIIAAGVDELTIIPCGPSRQNVLEAFARHVMEQL
jgi:5,10-methylenetetrahydromethanopterin reductase